MFEEHDEAQFRARRRSIAIRWFIYISLALFVEWAFMKQHIDLENERDQRQLVTQRYVALLSSVLSCVNEGGFSASFVGSQPNEYDVVNVVCKRVIGEWRNGVYYHLVHGKFVRNGDKLNLYARK